MLSDRKDGGQGRNRTADASLFRAALSDSYVDENLVVALIPAPTNGPVIGTTMEPARIPEFASHVPTSAAGECAPDSRWIRNEFLLNFTLNATALTALWLP